MNNFKNAHMNKFFSILFLFSSLFGGAHAAVAAEASEPLTAVAPHQFISAPTQVGDNNNVAQETELARLSAVRDNLKNEIGQIASERLRCEKQKKGWTAATILGGAGVAATGIAAIVQAKQISNKKDSLSNKEKELNNPK
jgi:hypothetical protein